MPISLLWHYSRFPDAAEQMMRLTQLAHRLQGTALRPRASKANSGVG